MVKMARVRCLIIFLGVLCGCALSSEITSALKDVQYCFQRDLAPCLVDHTIDRLLEVTSLTDVAYPTNESRSSSFSIEEKLFGKLMEAFGISSSDILDDVQRGRADPVLRTFNKAWKYIIPLLIGVKLKLATFVPIVLTILTLIAKSAFISGNMALLLTGLNIALKFWNPKMSSHQLVHQSYPQHNPYQHSEDYGHHHQQFFQNQQQEQFINHYETPYKNQKVSDIEFGTTISR